MRKNKLISKSVLLIFFVLASAIMTSCGAKMPKVLTESDLAKLQKAITFEDTDMDQGKIGGPVSFDPSDVKFDANAKTFVFVLVGGEKSDAEVAEPVAKLSIDKSGKLDNECKSGQEIGSVESKGFTGGEIGVIPDGTEFSEESFIAFCFRNEDLKKKPNTIFTGLKSAEITDNFEEPPPVEEVASVIEPKTSLGNAGVINDVILPEFDPVYFDFDKYDVNPEYLAMLELKVAETQDLESVRIVVEGHCDERGSNEYNLSLGERRATSIKKALGNMGIPLENITTISYGEENPVDYGHNEGAWKKNRRGIVIIRNSNN